METWHRNHNTEKYIHIISHCRDTRTEPRSQITHRWWNLDVRFLRYESGQINRQTYRTLIAILRIPTGGEITTIECSWELIRSSQSERFMDVLHTSSAVSSPPSIVLWSKRPVIAYVRHTVSGPLKVGPHWRHSRRYTSLFYSHRSRSTCCWYILRAFRVLLHLSWFVDDYS